MNDVYYTIDEVAKLFKVSRKTIYDWMKDGKLRYVWVGNHRRITKASLEAFVRPGEHGEEPEENRRAILVAA